MQINQQVLEAELQQKANDDTLVDDIKKILVPLFKNRDKYSEDDFNFAHALVQEVLYNLYAECCISLQNCTHLIFDGTEFITLEHFNQYLQTKDNTPYSNLARDIIKDEILYFYGIEMDKNVYYKNLKKNQAYENLKETDKYKWGFDVYQTQYDKAIRYFRGEEDLELDNKDLQESVKAFYDQFVKAKPQVLEVLKALQPLRPLQPLQPLWKLYIYRFILQAYKELVECVNTIGWKPDLETYFESKKKDVISKMDRCNKAIRQHNKEIKPRNIVV